LGITGVAISFNWVSNGLYAAGNLGEKYPAENRILTSDTVHQSYANNQPKMDQAFFVAMEQSPKAKMFLIYDDPAPQGTISITAYAKSLHYYNSDLYLFDKYSGKLLGVLPQRQKSPGKKLNEMNYDIHVGQIAGLPGKILAFLASLVCASLPITGLIIWLGKQKKTKTKQVKAVVHRRTQKIYQR
jgi:uncharacterized iron-regulated membrane protein